jgi:hypothetical protein
VKAVQLFIIRFRPEGERGERRHYVVAHSIDQAFHMLEGRYPVFEPDRAAWEVSDRYDLSGLHEPRILPGKQALRSL